MFTRKEILEIAKNQLAKDYNCLSSDFDKSKNTIVPNNLVEGRRIYSHDGCFLKMICFRGTAVISTAPEAMPWFEENILNRQAAWLFNYPKLNWINDKLREYEHEIGDIHIYYLPNAELLDCKPIAEVKWYEQEDILQFKGDDRFGEAFAFQKTFPDVLAVAAMDGDKIMGMAGASADSSTMWQIGIDVMPEYRGRGIGTYLVTLLRNEIFMRDKVPFYSTAQSHFHSQNIALNAGFYPAWAELYSRKI